VKSLTVKYDKQLILSAVIYAAVSTQVIANDTAMTRWVDEFALDRYPLSYNTHRNEPSYGLIYRKAKEVKSPVGLYVGTQNSPHVLTSDPIADSDAKQTTLVDSYFGLRQQFSIFSYNIGVKSYNNERNHVSKNWTNLNLDEFYAGIRYNQFGVGIAQNRTASHSRLSYYQKLYATAFQIDMGTTTIFESGEKYLEWKFNASKQYKELRVAFSVNKGFAPDHSLPTEAYIEVSRVFSLKHL
jgi:hypothetical protein